MISEELDTDQKYYTQRLKRIVYEFYQEHRESCAEQYNMAEAPDIDQLYENIEKKELNRILAHVSVVVLTANKYEKNILHSNWSKRTDHKKIYKTTIPVLASGGDEYEPTAYLFEWHGYQVMHIAAIYTGSYTIGGSADIVRYIVDSPRLNPSVIISYGICFGLNENNQKMGDVIISDKVYPYFIGSKINENGYYVKDDNVFRIRRKIKGKLQNGMDENYFKDFGFSVSIGNYLTGEAVVSDFTFREAISRITTQDVNAGEMEGYGLFKECYSRDCIIPCLIIKSICDWGALKNTRDTDLFEEICGKSDKYGLDEIKTVKDRIQAYASYHSFLVLDKLLEKKVFLGSLYEQLKRNIIEDKNENGIYNVHVQKKLKALSKLYYQTNRANKQRTTKIIDALVAEKVLQSPEKCLDEDIHKRGKRNKDFWKINRT
ncbi:MAG: hypothetical protein LIP10_09445 [Clostridiales bacterium]|nr:hypothetical protein [Clostridiales bacterium]